jgi:hypothetical protein
MMGNPSLRYPLMHPDVQAMAAFDAFMHKRFDRQGESPCWYREQIESVDETSPDRYVIVSRAFMHEWPDKPRSTPISRVYDVVVIRTSGAWQVESLGPGRDERQEPGEPGATTSACAVARQTPIPQKGAPVGPPTRAPH